MSMLLFKQSITSTSSITIISHPPYNYTSSTSTSTSSASATYCTSTQYGSNSKVKTLTTKQKEQPRKSVKRLQQSQHDRPFVTNDYDDEGYEFDTSKIKVTDTAQQLQHDDDDIMNKSERLQKRLSRVGVSSRRNAEKLIEDGRVTVNGQVANMKSFMVTPSCVIAVDGKQVTDTIPRIWMHNKLKKVLVTNAEDPERDTLIPILKRVLDKQHLISVGRLDYYSEGLILMTNDGELSRFLELPANGFQKTYRVRLFGKITPEMNTALTKGVMIDGIKYAPVKLSVESESTSNTWVQVTLTEGKNREIRRIFEHFNVKVLRIIRIKYGPYTLPASLKPGETQEVVIKDELKSFKNKWITKEKFLKKRHNQMMLQNQQEQQQ
ncbi:hypothetical protein SAMD00019534_049960 [Acytostelium subglobosum LB1]|uniref:hypothetical protein n=1 Tax=Acytostelium subglobosum LB1 TaxID=1410327 RepID=UPI00064495D0|nr:hypothetical protein SAMD00019534_049960 [Acytostelium subglobosum LB1]GAM21821.1 hypothetical protein SAMD00019534_049960 [Acytostelium subglobosum LB1]|eukprot:XP_012754921.1 hypothetical protein SAMD00019534_049960 [Acytostelium subglobosum LB1]